MGHCKACNKGELALFDPDRFREASNAYLAVALRDGPPYSLGRKEKHQRLFTDRETFTAAFQADTESVLSNPPVHRLP